LLAVAFGDGQGQFAFALVAVSDLHDGPVVDDGDGVEVDRDLVGVVGGRVEGGQVGAQSPGAPVVAQGGEGGGEPLRV
jgi:hypothetical protein